MFFRSKNKDKDKDKNSNGREKEKEKLGFFRKPNLENSLIAQAFPNSTFQNHWNPQNSYKLGFNQNVTITAFNPVQNLLAIASDSGQIMVFGKSGIHTQLFQPNPHENAPIVYIKFHIGYPLLIAVDILNAICIVDYSNNVLCGYYETPQRITCINVVRGSPWLLIGQDSGRVYFINIEKHIKSDFSLSYKGRGANQPIESINVHPNSINNILLGYLDGQIAYYCIEQDRVLSYYKFDPKVIPGFGGKVATSNLTLTSMSWYPDGSNFAAAFDNGIVVIFSALNSTIKEEKIIILTNQDSDSNTYQNDEESPVYFISDLECFLDGKGAKPYLIATAGNDQWQRKDLVFIDPNSGKFNKVSFAVPILSQCNLTSVFTNTKSNHKCVALSMDDGSVKFYEYDSLNIFTDDFSLSQLIPPEPLCWDSHLPQIIEFSSIVGSKTVSLKPSNSRINRDTSDFIRGGNLISSFNVSKRLSSPRRLSNANQSPNAQGSPLNRYTNMPDFGTKRTSIAITYNNSKLISLWDVSKPYPQMVSIDDIDLSILGKILNLRLTPTKLYFNSLNKILVLGMASGTVLMYYIGDSPPSWVQSLYNEQLLIVARNSISSKKLDQKLVQKQLDLFAQLEAIKEEPFDKASGNLNKPAELGENSDSSYSNKRNSIRSSIRNSIRSSIRSSIRNSIHSYVSNSNRDSLEQPSISNEGPRKSSASSLKSVIPDASNLPEERITEAEVRADSDAEKFIGEFDNCMKPPPFKPLDDYIEIIPINKSTLNESSIQFVFPLIYTKYHQFSIACLTLSEDCKLFISDSAGHISCVDITTSKVVGWVSGQRFVRNDCPYRSTFSSPQSETASPATILHCDKLKLDELEEPTPLLIAVFNNDIVMYYSYLEGEDYSGTLKIPNIGKIIYVDTMPSIDYSAYVDQNGLGSDQDLDGGAPRERHIKRQILVLVGTKGIAAFHGPINSHKKCISSTSFTKDKIISASKIFWKEQVFFLQCVDSAGFLYVISVPHLTVLFKASYSAITLEANKNVFLTQDGGIHYIDAENNLCKHTTFGPRNPVLKIFDPSASKPNKIKCSSGANWWLWNLASMSVPLETRLEKNFRDISTNLCKCSKQAKDISGSEAMNTGSVPGDSGDLGASVPVGDNQGSSSVGGSGGAKGSNMLSETAQKLREREEKLNQVSDSTAKMAGAASDFLQEIREYNKAQEKKKWWQF